VAAKVSYESSDCGRRSVEPTSCPASRSSTLLTAPCTPTTAITLVAYLYYYRTTTMCGPRMSMPTPLSPIFGKGPIPTRFFNTDFLSRRYKDVAAAGSDPLPQFDTRLEEGPAIVEFRSAAIASDYNYITPQHDPLNTSCISDERKIGLPRRAAAISSRRTDSITPLPAAQSGLSPHSSRRSVPQYERSAGAGRNPNASSRQRDILRLHATVAASGMIPLDHYPDFDARGPRSVTDFDTNKFLRPLRIIRGASRPL